MADREKVISDLQEYHDREWTDERIGGVHARDERKRITGEVLALLKEQEENPLKRILALPNCNNCGKKDCQHKPLPGETVRINCFDWEEQGDGRK